MIQITEKAAEKIREMKDSLNAGDRDFRIGLIPGGCRGLSYEFGFDHHREDDMKSTDHGATILVSPDVLEKVDGMTIDFVEEMAGSMFVFRNPRAAATCSCGNSFSG
ncbi:MAG: iron-sulfur cluster assembly accessory protein [Nitrospinota bacterium]|nr:iron-sulfur cluster assembly accessory protein [Nitrospinota bacterium]